MAMTAEQHLARAVHAQQQGRPADVQREVEAALRLNPEHPVALNMLGMEALGCTSKYYETELELFSARPGSTNR